MNLYGGRDPYPSQRLLLKATEPFIVVAGNRGCTKSTAGCWKILTLCIDNPGIRGFIGRWIKDDLYATTLEVWRECFPPEEWSHVYTFEGGTVNEPSYIKFSNGSLIFLFPLQHYEKKLRGGSFAFGFIDQMEECPQDVWSAAVKCVRAPIWEREKQYPYNYILDRKGNRIDEGDRRRLILATVNKSRGWYWIKRIFEEKRGMSFDEANLYRLIVPKWDENVRLVKAGYYDNIKRNAKSEAEIKFEVFGEDPSEFGLVFPEFDHRHIRKFEFSQLKDPSFYLGYDEGWDAQSAFLFMAIDSDGVHWWRAEHYAKETTISLHLAKLVEIANRINFPMTEGQCRFIAERAIFGKRDGYGRSIADQWREIGVNWDHGIKDPPSQWSQMNSLIHPDQTGKVRFVVHEDDCPNFIDQIKDAYYDEKFEGQGKIQKRCVKHCLDAAGYTVLTSRTPSAFRPPPKLDGTWKQFLQAKPGKSSFLAPSSWERPEKLFVPRKAE